MAQDPKIYSIKEITRYIKMKLESDIVLGDVWLRGEISNFTHHSSRHMYFTLKDADSRLKCIMFASQNQRLPFVPKEGMKVLARGNFSVYERDGNYQFYVMQMQPDGIGSLYTAYEQLKRKLELEGLFAEARKRPIPRYPRTVGVITSQTGAAVRDIMITLQRRYPAVPVLLYPVLVQGKGAAPAIVKAIESMNRHGEADVLIVGRGGGSLEELWAFNEEIVARAIAGSAIPVISAVGHETDFTIADFVADLRAATPTAAAELAVPNIRELKAGLVHLETRLQNSLKRMLDSKQERLARAAKSSVFVNPRRILLQQAERLDRLNEGLTSRMMRRQGREQERLLRLRGALSAVQPTRQLAAASRQLQHMNTRLETAFAAGLKDKQTKLASAMRQLDALSPLKVMARGYSLVYDEHEKKLIKSIGQVQPGDVVKVKVADGQLECQVWAMKGEQ